MERGVGLIVVGALLQIVELDFGRGNVAVVDTNLAVFLLIINMVVVKHSLHLHLGGISKDLVAVKAVLIDGNVAVKRQLEDVGKEVQLLVDGLHGIVEAGISILVEVYLTINVTPPHNVLRHVNGCGEHQAGTHRQSLILSLLLLLCLLLGLLLPTGLRLCHCCACHQRYHQ